MDMAIPMNNPTSTIHKVRTHGRVNLKSPIFWRITAGVFASILLIELVLLIFSWFTERDRLVTRLDESLVTVTSLLDYKNPVPQLDKLLQNQTNISTYRVNAYIYESAEGVRRTGGADSDIDQILNEQKPSMYSSRLNTYSIYVSRELGNGRADRIWLCVDTSNISDYMVGYVWRILGMVVLISAFVTGACLVFMNPILIKPLQRLDNLLVQGEKMGMRTAHAEDKDINRQDELGSVFRSFGHLRNELIKSEDQNTFINNRFEDFANLGADCFFEVDRNNTITYIAGDVSRLLSISPENILGTSLSDFLEKMASRLPARSDIARSLNAIGKWEGEILPESVDSTCITVRVASSRFYDAKGNYAGIRGTIIDTSKETELANSLRYQATHDHLTGLCNRREFSDRIKDSISKFKADGTTFSLLTIDLDHFKSVNDTCGHIAGDILLKAIAKSMQGSVRSSDTVARIGGDEFAIILHGANLSAAMKIAEQLRKGINDYELKWEGVPQSVSASMGLVEVNPELADLEALTMASDNNCMAAKQAGKNRVHVQDKFSPLNANNNDGRAA